MLYTNITSRAILVFDTRCCMIGVRACSEDFCGATVRAFISDMESSGFGPCRENRNNLKWEQTRDISYLFIHNYGIQKPSDIRPYSQSMKAG